MKRWLSFLVIVLLVAIFVSSGVWGLSVVQQAGAQANTACYGEQGGAKWVAGSGCEYEFQAGSTLDVDGTADFSGATVTGLSTSTLESLTVTGATLITDNLTVDGTLAVTGAVTFGALDGTANDVTFRSDTAGDYMLWDQSEEALTIVGTNGQDALNVDDGNVDIADDLDVDGTTNLDDVDIDLTTSMNVDGHMLDVGSGTYTVADGDNDLGVDGDLEVNGAAHVGGTATLAGLMILPQQTLVVTAGFTITPTATYVVLTSTGGAHTSSTTIPIATTGMITGQLVIIRNGNASDELTIDGTGGTVECKADKALGASDIQTLIFNGTEWNCIAAVADNS